MAVKILIDSASDISMAEAKELGVIMMPMIISFGDQDYNDGVDLLPTEFYEKLIESDVMPKTSQISQYRFEEAFEEYTKNGDTLVVITISSKLSGTYNSAKLASENFAGKVFVVDSLSAAIGERLLCQYGLRLVDEGLSAKEVADKLDVAKNKINIIAIVNTLEYLKKGGRISSAVAFAGSMLSIKPVLSVVDGKVELIGKAMGSKKATNHLNRIVEEKGVDFSMPYGVLWAGLDRSVLDKYIKDSAALWQDYTDNIPSYILGGTIGTHVGPGAVGVAFFEK